MSRMILPTDYTDFTDYKTLNSPLGAQHLELVRLCRLSEKNWKRVSPITFRLSPCQSTNYEVIPFSRVSPRNHQSPSTLPQKWQVTGAFKLFFCLLLSKKFVCVVCLKRTEKGFRFHISFNSLTTNPLHHETFVKGFMPQPIDYQPLTRFMKPETFFRKHFFVIGFFGFSG